MSELSYAVWPAGSRVRVCNVRWDQLYRDVVSFDSRVALNTYLAGTDNKTYDNVSYVRADQPVILEDPFSVLWKYNYVHVYNPAQGTAFAAPDAGQNFYYFITDVKHMAPNSTALILSLDVFQTFFYETTFGRCFVERGHVGIAQANQMSDYGRRYLSAPEGLDLGSAYLTRRENNEGFTALGGGYAIYATCDLQGDFGTEDAPNIPPLSSNGIRGYYTAVLGNVINRLPAWIRQCIVAAYRIPDITTYYPDFVPTNTPEANYLTPLPEIYNPSNNPDYENGRTIWAALETTWRNNVEGWVGARYAGLHKFKTAPYCVIELTHGADNALTLSPQLFDTAGLYVQSELSLGLGATTLRAIPKNYNGVELDGSHFTTVGGLPQPPIINDQGALALANTAHTRAYQTSSMAYNRDQALRANQAGYDATQRGLAASQTLSDLQGQFATSQQAQQADWASQDAWRKGLTNVGTGLAVGTLAGGGVPGAVGGATVGIANTILGSYDATIQNNRAALTTAQANAQSQALLDVNKGLTGANADANKALADSTVQGNYAMAVNAQLASIADTENSAPSVVAMPQGSLDLLRRGRNRIRVRVKMPDQGTIARIGEFWLRYGYAIGEYVNVPSNARVMSEFTYWKMTECNLVTAPMPETYKNVLKSIFERGTTVHRTPASIGVNVTNNPIVGSYY